MGGNIVLLTSSMKTFQTTGWTSSQLVKPSRMTRTPKWTKMTFILSIPQGYFVLGPNTASVRERQNGIFSFFVSTSSLHPWSLHRLFSHLQSWTYLKLTAWNAKHPP